MNSKSEEVGIKWVKRNTLAKQVVDQIIGLLTSGKLNPGDKLPPEMELMDKLGVSRPVLREALSSLETIGIVQRKTREGTFFSNKIGSEPFSIMLALSSGNLPSVMEARMSIELGLVTLAAEKITDSQLRELRGTLEDIANSQGDYSEADKEFHRIIAYSANNPIVEGMVDPLLTMVNQMLDQVSEEYRDRNVTLEYHTSIYNALKKHDPVEAFTCMYRHLEYGRNKVLKIISD